MSRLSIQTIRISAVADPGGGGGWRSRRAPNPPPYFHQILQKSPKLGKNHQKLLLLSNQYNTSP